MGELGHIGRNAPPPGRRSPLDRKHVLIIDGSSLTTPVAVDALLRAGYQVTVPRTFVELDRYSQAYGPDLILIEVVLPHIFGDDLGRYLRKVRRVDAPIFLFSWLDTDELIKRATDAGLDGVISKREGLRTLIARVHSILTPPEGR